MPATKETKAQRVERLKLEKNAWDHLDEIRQFAQQGHSSIPPEWLSTYFRTWGIYTQGDGNGVLGGSGGEGKSTPYFMVRIRIPNGLLTSQQVHTIADLSTEHGNGVADITVRQNIQLHWVRIEFVPEILERLAAVGLSTTGACGDVVRNITGCPLAGVHAHELADVRPLLRALDQELGGNPEFYNLPRKFKISVTACPDWCSYPEINDIALVAAVRPRRNHNEPRHSERSPRGEDLFSFPRSSREESLFHPTINTGRLPATGDPAANSDSNDNATTDLHGSATRSAIPEELVLSPTSHESQVTDHEFGFSLRVGGGLSTQPHLSVRLNVFVQVHQVIPVVRAITEIFRESDVLRHSREKARMKYLFLEHSWTAESFLAILESKLGYSLDPAEPETPPAQIHRDHLGVIPQKQPGLYTIGAAVTGGRITPEQLRTAADLAERYGDGHVRNTPMQNLLLINIPEAHVSTVVDELTAAGLPVETSAFLRGTVACTGSEFCKLALTETKSFARWLTEQLEERFPNYQEQLRLHITGCPNSCGQHWIADIGVEGKKIKTNGKMVDAYYFCVGGSVGEFAAIARPIGYRCAADEVPDAITRLLDYFHEQREGGEPLQKFLARHSTESLRAVLAGGPAEIAERDLATAATPHSVEDR
jgi:sulfite reductase beta subunit-like hemoprotein